MQNKKKLIEETKMEKKRILVIKSRPNEEKSSNHSEWFLVF